MDPIAVVKLPVDDGCNSPLLRRQLEELRGKTLSVRLDRCGLDQLPQLLATQRPEAVVLSSGARLSARDVQRMTDAAFRYCRTVSVVGGDAGIGWHDHIAVRVHGAVRAFCFLDAAAAKEGHLVLFGELQRLRHLTVTGGAHVHLAGPMLATTDMCIRARSLVINDTTMPVVGRSPDGAYVWTSMRQPRQQPRQQPRPSKRQPHQPPPPPPSPVQPVQPVSPQSADRPSPVKLLHPRPRRLV